MHLKIDCNRLNLGISAALSFFIVASFVLLGRQEQALAADRSKLTEAIALYNNKDYRGAAALLDQYLAANTRDPYAAYYAALSQQQLGNSGKARIYYRLVYGLAPTSQIGVYARNILLKLDPSFAASLQKSTAAGSAGAGNNSDTSSEQALVKAIVDSPSGESDEALDRSMPSECRLPFKKSSRGIYLDCQLNGRPISMEFDTGAPDVVLGKNHLRTLGIALPTGKPDGSTGGSASAEKVPFWMVNATVKVGPMERRNMPVMVMEEDHSNPLLGQTFFHNYDTSIDDSSGQILFRQRALAANQGLSGAAISVPFEFRSEGSRIIVQTEVNGKSFPMIFDTGNTANACSFMSAAQAEKAGVKVPADAVITTHHGVNGAGQAKSFQIRSLKLGPIEKRDVWVSVNLETEDANSIEAPLLGQPFWQGYEYSIDRKKRLIHFVRR